MSIECIIFISIIILYVIHKYYIMYKHVKRQETAEFTGTTLISQWAIEKARNNPDYMKCLQSGICPSCENKDLREKVYGAYDQFSDHHCVKCGFATLCEVLY